MSSLFAGRNCPRGGGIGRRPRGARPFAPRRRRRRRNPLPDPLLTSPARSALSCPGPHRPERPAHAPRPRPGPTGSPLPRPAPRGGFGKTDAGIVFRGDSPCSRSRFIGEAPRDERGVTTADATRAARFNAVAAHNGVFWAPGTFHSRPRPDRRRLARPKRISPARRRRAGAARMDLTQIRGIACIGESDDRIVWPPGPIRRGWGGGPGDSFNTAVYLSRGPLPARGRGWLLSRRWATDPWSDRIEAGRSSAHGLTPVIERRADRGPGPLCPSTRRGGRTSPLPTGARPPGRADIVFGPLRRAFAGL